MAPLPFIQLYPTLRCNQKCSFCFNQGIQNGSTYKDMEEKNAYNLAHMLIKNNIPELDILGGEPTLVPWMIDFSRYVTDSGITLNISSNGSLPKEVKEFAAIQTNILNIGFSLHGFEKTHNTLTMSENYKVVIAGISAMISSGKNPIVKSTLTYQNKNELREFIAYLGKRGVKRYYLLHEDVLDKNTAACSFSFPEFWGIYSGLRADLKGIIDIGFVAASGFFKYGKQYHLRCDAGTQKIAVLPDGSAFPCNLFFRFPEFYLGNIFTDGIDKIVDNPILSHFRQQSEKTCASIDCLHHSSCTGGCPAHSYLFYQRINAPDPRCFKREAKG
jgi:radical SAM protein with 4Fe4S-binding SPASM domain